jgi:hypothetical protein
VSTGAVRVGVGTRFLYDGEVVEITEMHASAAGLQAVLRNVRTQHVQRMATGELLASDHVRVLPDDTRKEPADNSLPLSVSQIC